MSDHHLPSPSVWPMTLAGGVTLVGLGVLTGASALWALGLLFMVWAIFSWIQDLRRAA